MSKALSPAEFSAAMAPLGPFEPSPRVAVAVSGGADSLALALLAAHWCHDRGGTLVAVTVDHRLRPNSTAEAVMVGGWLANHGINQRILTWDGPKPTSDIQARARAARFALVEEFCRDQGILHVLLAHHQDDQAETFLLRLARGSGVDGLAAMAAIRDSGAVRWLRPLLDVPKARLVATLRARDQDWVEDPSNRDPRHARVRLRQLAPTLAAEGLEPRRLAATAHALARARQALDRAVADAILDHVAIDPAGFARVDGRAWEVLPDEVALRLLAHLVRVMGGDATVPRLERTERLLARFRRGLGGGTLGGARLVLDAGSVLVCREAGRVAPPIPVPPGTRTRWDGRFMVAVAPQAPTDLSIGALGPQGWRRVCAGAARKVPAWVRPGLAAIFDQDGVFAVPHLGYNRMGITTEPPVRVWPAVGVPLTNVASAPGGSECERSLSCLGAASHYL